MKVTFPADYPQDTLAGKDAEFTVTMKEVKAPDPVVIDDVARQSASASRPWACSRTACATR